MSHLADDWPVDPICGFVAASNIENIPGYSNWSCTINGSTASDVCAWDGIVCSEGLISSISLSNQDLFGTLSSLLGTITSLPTLAIVDSNLFSTLPDALGSLTGLTGMFLWENSLTGTLPAVFGSLTDLALLDLSGNSLNGTVPAELGFVSVLSVLY